MTNPAAMLQPDRTLTSWPDHVVPIDDMREHILSIECWCRPRFLWEKEDGCMPFECIVHNSLDGRERYEVADENFQ